MSAPTGLIFVDSFDHYNTLSEMQRKWTITAGLVPPGAPSSNFTTGRSGSGQAMLIGATYGLPLITFGWNFPTICPGVAYTCQALSNSIVEGSGIGLTRWRLAHVGDGRVMFLVGGDSTGPINGFVMALNTWYFFEISVNITANLYTYEIKANNATIASGTLVASTVGASVLGTQSLSFGGPSGGLLCAIDDLQVTDGEFLGDTNWGVIYPNAPGDATDWTPNPAVANWINTSEHAPDDFTSYNQADVVANQDLYNMDDLGGTFRIVGIQALNCVTKSASGVSSIKGTIKTNGSLNQEPEFFPSFSSWLYQRTGYRKNPITGLDFTSAEINAIQRGALRIT